MISVFHMPSFFKANLQHILHPLYRLKTNLQRGFEFRNLNILLLILHQEIQQTITCIFQNIQNSFKP